MAEQKGIIPLQGTIGNITFLKSADGYRARAKGAGKKDHRFRFSHLHNCKVVLQKLKLY